MDEKFVWRISWIIFVFVWVYDMQTDKTYVYDSRIRDDYIFIACENYVQYKTHGIVDESIHEQ